MLAVQRDEAGRVVAVDSVTSSDSAAVEAWTIVEIDRIGGEQVDVLTEELLDALAAVRPVVDDREAMRDRAIALADELAATGSPGEAPDLLRWLVGQRFVFLGAARYALDGGAAPTSAVEGSQLGLLRAPHVIDPPFTDDGSPLSITRSVMRSSVYRPQRLAVVSVRRRRRRERRGRGPHRRAVRRLRLPPERDDHPDAEGVGRVRARALRLRRRHAHRAGVAGRARGAPARRDVRDAPGRAPRPGDRRRRLAGAPAGARVRDPRADQPVRDRTGVPAQVALHLRRRGGGGGVGARRLRGCRGGARHRRRHQHPGSDPCRRPAPAGVVDRPRPRSRPAGRADRRAHDELDRPIALGGDLGGRRARRPRLARTLRRRGHPGGVPGRHRPPSRGDRPASPGRPRPPARPRHLAARPRRRTARRDALQGVPPRRSAHPLGRAAPARAPRADGGR